MQNKKKANWGSLARLLRFLWQDYKLSLSIAFVLIGCLLSYWCDCQLCVITPHGNDFARFSAFPS